MVLDQRKGLPDAGQHAERQDVDLQNAEPVEIVLVPFVAPPQTMPARLATTSTLRPNALPTSRTGPASPLR
jgi:hypothetical protein